MLLSYSVYIYVEGYYWVTNQWKYFPKWFRGEMGMCPDEMGIETEACAMSSGEVSTADAVGHLEMLVVPQATSASWSPCLQSVPPVPLSRLSTWVCSQTEEEEEEEDCNELISTCLDVSMASPQTDKTRVRNQHTRDSSLLSS